MIHKMGFDCVCEKCGKPKMFDEIQDSGNGWCVDCYDHWFENERAYWKPLYDGEVLGGFHRPEPKP